jgi:galactonate dehydratase
MAGLLFEEPAEVLRREGDSVAQVPQGEASPDLFLHQVQAFIDHAPGDVGAPLPVYEMLGGIYRDRIRIYGHCWGATTEKIINRALERQKKGFTAIKILVEPFTANRGVKRYIESQKVRFREIREALGDDMDIAIDFHGRLSPDIAIQVIREIEEYYPLFVEEACLPENTDAMARIAAAVKAPLATGERLVTRSAFRPLFEKGAVSIVQPDLCHAGDLLLQDRPP